MSSSVFPGIGIGGYRSFGAEPQLLGPLDRVSLIVGPNNTGKSNFLSLFYRHANGLREALTLGSQSGSFEGAVDAHNVGSAAPPPPTVLWPIDTEAIASAHHLELLSALTNGLFRHDTVLSWMTYRAVGIESEWKLAPEWVAQIEAGVYADWRSLSEELTSTTGGGPQGDVLRVLDWIARNALLKLPPTQFIPSHRQIRGGGPNDLGDTWTLDGQGLINRLDRLKNASFREVELKNAYAAIRRGLADLLEVADCDYVVPKGMNPALELVIDGEHRPLDSFGTGFESALLIVAATVAFPDDLFCIEEPELHLHPRLQRQLGIHLRDRTQSQLLISTHSAHLIDVLRQKTFRTQLVDKATKVTVPLDADNILLLDELGYRASDILQSNCIIWVEGPSDRIYINSWIAAADGRDLVEGAHYVIMYYGGALLSRATAVAEGDEGDGRVLLRRIHQHFAVVADSDRSGDVETLKARVLRVSDEVDSNVTSTMWITAGRTIENYIDPNVLGAAVKTVHPSVTSCWSGRSYEEALFATRADGTRLVAIDKVAVAEEVVRSGVHLEILDLSDQVRALIKFIRESNS